MQPIKRQSDREAELEKLRRELLQKIMDSEAQRQAARGSADIPRSRSA